MGSRCILPNHKRATTTKRNIWLVWAAFGLTTYKIHCVSVFLNSVQTNNINKWSLGCIFASLKNDFERKEALASNLTAHDIHFISH